MSYKITKMHKFRDGRLHIYKQSNCLFWLIRFYAEGRYKHKSSKTKSFTTAKEIAFDWFDEIRFNQKHGVPVHAITFQYASEQFRFYQNSLIERGDRTQRQAKDYEYRIEMLNRFFAKHNISLIDTKAIDEYITLRITPSKEFEVPVKYKTVKYDLTALRQVFKYCILQGWIKALPLFPDSKKEKTNPRPWFDHDEWQLLLKTSKERIKNAPDKNKRWKRQSLHDFMVFSVHTGVRVQECHRIRYGDCKILKKKSKRNNGEDDYELRFEVQGKTGIRKVRGTIGAVTIYKKLCEENKDEKTNKPKPTDLLFPHNHRDGLNALLKSCRPSLKTDRHGRTRNAKSFRSTFIMFGLLRGLKDRDIADNCGNSPDIIHKYYAKYINIDMIGESFTDLPD